MKILTYHAVALTLWLPLCLNAAAPDTDRSILPPQPQAFQGKIGRTLDQSEAAFTVPLAAPEGAPNIIVILTDDVGFASTSTFGGPVPTPALDQLASEGLRYNRFHTTAMCSPTRAALLTGRNSHAVGAGIVADMVTGFPGYTAEIPRSAATVAEILRNNGFNTAFFGKHHNIPYAHISPAGPFDFWPTGLGFEYFYGFFGGDTDQYHPKLYRGNSPEPASLRPENQLLDKTLAEDAINWIHNQQATASGKPFFIYYAPGTAHAPHQAPKEWIAKFKGQFDRGWDALREESFERQKKAGIIPADAALTPRPEAIPAWTSLSEKERRVSARMMEVFAATIAYQDHQIGRIFAELKRMGQFDNTLIVFVEGDNGSSGEGGIHGSSNELGGMVNGIKDTPDTLAKMMDQLGGPKSYQLAPAGWAWATNAPFQWHKQVASHLGGNRNGMVMSWPAGISDQGAVRSQFHHVIDIMPTVLDAAGIPIPVRVNGVDQQPVDGISMRYSFDNADAASRRTTQYFEILGNRAIYHEGWMAGTHPPRLTWEMNAPTPPADTGYTWELYHLDEDYSQSRDLAAEFPDKLAELQELWWQEAERNQVLPIDDRNGYRRTLDGPPSPISGQTEFAYWGRDISVAQRHAPQLAMRSFTVSADVEIEKGRNDGVLLATGSWFGGWSFYLENGYLVGHCALSQQPEFQYRVKSPRPLPTGSVQLRFDFEYDGGGPGKGGMLKISANGKELASGRIERTPIITAGLGETLDIGRDTGVPVVDSYREREGRFTGSIDKVQVQLR